MDFAALSPEINSGRMYIGPGSGPMRAAAASWHGLAADTSSAASDYGSVIAGLTSGPWRGPASVSMASAAAPYVSWMGATAAQAEQAAGQAKAVATAYETAFALTVPPPVIAANRALLTSLIATNFLGQNTPAIAATEAHYAEMWAQDAAAMYGYAGSSAAASALPPFVQPPATTSVAAQEGQTAAVGQATDAATQTGLSQLISTMPVALQGLAGPASSTSSASGISGIFDLLAGNDGSQTGLAGLFNDLFSSNGLGLNANIWNTIFSSGFYMPGNWLGTMTDLASLAGAGAAADAAGDAAAGAAAAEELGSALAGPAVGLGGLGGLGNAVSAALGKAASIGPLSIPPSWTAVSPVASPLPPLLGGTPISAPPAVAAGVPGMPFTSAAGNHINGAAPRYGFRPTVISHSPAAG